MKETQNSAPTAAGVYFQQLLVSGVFQVKNFLKRCNLY